MLSLLWAQVRSLVRELRSRKPHGAAKKKKLTVGSGEHETGAGPDDGGSAESLDFNLLASEQGRLGLNLTCPSQCTSRVNTEGY